jgi:hypothetical protein
MEFQNNRAKLDMGGLFIVTLEIFLWLDLILQWNLLWLK